MQLKCISGLNIFFECMLLKDTLTWRLEEPGIEPWPSNWMRHSTSYLLSHSCPYWSYILIIKDDWLMLKYIYISMQSVSELIRHIGKAKEQITPWYHLITKTMTLKVKLYLNSPILYAVNSLYLYVVAESLTCMDTCQGQEWGLAGSPFTMRDTTTGGMAGFPHALGQSRKWEESHCNISGVWLFVHVWMCLCINKAWIYSTYLQLTDKPVCSNTGADALIHIFEIIYQLHQLATVNYVPLFLAFGNTVCSVQCIFIQT